MVIYLYFRKISFPFSRFLTFYTKFTVQRDGKRKRKKIEENLKKMIDNENLAPFERNSRRKLIKRQ